MDDLFLDEIELSESNTETTETVITPTNTEEIELLTLLNDNLKTTNTLIMIIFIAALCILIYNLMWKFIKFFL